MKRLNDNNGLMNAHGRVRGRDELGKLAERDFHDFHDFEGGHEEREKGRMKMETFVGVPPQHPAYRLGCKHVHAGCWQPPDDRGGLSNVVSLTLPEVDDITFGIALSRAQMLKARILVVARYARPGGKGGVAHRADTARVSPRLYRARRRSWMGIAVTAKPEPMIEAKEESK